MCMNNTRTFEQAIYEIVEQERWKWCATWFRLGEIIFEAPYDRGCVKHPDTKYLNGMINLGCRGISHTGKLAWVGFDLDVSHGREKDKYESTDAALISARKIRDYLKGHAEIRLSKSGHGVHVRHFVQTDRPGEDGAKIAKAIVKKLDIRADPSALGRQAHWLWTANPKPNSFKLIEPHFGIEVQIA